MRACDRTINFQSTQTRHTQILIQCACRTIANHINRPRDRIRRHRRTACQSLQQYQAKSIGQTRKDKYIRGRIHLRQALGIEHAQIVRFGEMLFEFIQRRPFAHHPFAAGQIKLEKCFDIFLHRHTPDIQKNRFRRIEHMIGTRMKMLGIHAARPHLHIGKTVLL